MESPRFATLLLLCQLLVVYNGVQGRIQRFSTEEEYELEKQLNHRNKPAIKTIRTQYGDLYDCVSNKQQTAVGQPLLKNITRYFQENRTALHKRLRDQVIVEVNVGLKSDECPGGTIPIRRVTKKDLIRQQFHHKRGALPNDKSNGVTDYAVCRTKGGSNKFKGASAVVAIYNPTVTSQQYSAARLKLQHGPDSIEAGWRVDPTLYGDKLTRFYIHTDDTEGNWVLIVGADNNLVGYWPKTIFSNKGLADYAEWGGEAFSPDSTTKPRMCAGHLLYEEDTSKDAFFEKVNVVDESGHTVDTGKLDCSFDQKFYEARDEGNVNIDFEHLIFYRGPGSFEI